MIEAALRHLGVAVRVSPQTLLDLAAMLAVAADVLKRSSGREAELWVRLIRQKVDELKAAAVRLDASPTLDAEVLAHWRHGLIAPIAAMVGWARLFSEARDPTARLWASEAIERNAKELGRLLDEHMAGRRCDAGDAPAPPVDHP